MFPTVTLKWPVKMSQNQSRTLKSQLIRLAKTCLTHSRAVQTSLLMTLKLQQTLSKTPPTKMIQRAVNQIMIRTNSKSHQLTANKMIKTMLQTMWVIWQAQIIKEIQLLPMMKRSTTKPMQTKVQMKYKTTWLKTNNNSNPVFKIVISILLRKKRKHHLLKSNQNKLRIKNNKMKFLKNQQEKTCKKNWSYFKSSNRK